MRRLLVHPLALAALVGLLLASAPAARAAELTATPATLAGVFEHAGGGDTILLAPGDYGTFRGGAKPGLVTLRPAGAGPVSLAVDFDPAANVRIEGVTITRAEIGGASRDVAIADSTFTGAAVLRGGRMLNANVVLERNRHAGIDVCGGCYEGRIQIAGHAGGPSGIVIRDSVLGPGGNADGIQNGGWGVSILGNEFVDLHASGGVHTDALQLYGSHYSVIRGNYIHDADDGIVAFDGADHETIEDNVVDTGPHGQGAIILGSDDGSVVAHNTLRGCGGASCGHFIYGSKEGATPGVGTVVRDNALAAIARVGDGSLAARSHNLIASGTPGDSEIRASPAFAGGASPTTFEGFVLAPGSPGKGTASDGTDRGIRVTPGRVRPLRRPPLRRARRASVGSRRSACVRRGTRRAGSCVAGCACGSLPRFKRA